MKNVAVKELTRIEFIPEQPEENSSLYKTKGQIVSKGFLWWKKSETITENIWNARDICITPFKLSDRMYITDIQYSEIFREDLTKGILVRKCAVQEYDCTGAVVKSTIFDSSDEGVKYYNEMIGKWNLRKIK